MKSLRLTFSLSLVLTSISFSQSLPDSSAIWTIASISMGSYFQNNTYSYETDTIINSLTYVTIFTTNDSIYDPSNSNYYCAVREYEGRWFFVLKDQTNEYLLYDFNVNIGDTVIINNPWTDGEKELIVFNTDSLELTDKYYRTIDVGFYDGPSGQPNIIDRWIKGIGSTNGLFYSGFYICDIGYQLLCFHRNDTLIYLDSPDGTCGYILVGIKPKTLSEEIEVSPNPVIDLLIIGSKDDLVIKLYDNTGKYIFTTNNKSIDISKLNAGIYFIQIFDLNLQLLKSEKIIKL